MRPQWCWKPHPVLWFWVIPEYSTWSLLIIISLYQIIFHLNSDSAFCPRQRGPGGWTCHSHVHVSTRMLLPLILTELLGHIWPPLENISTLSLGAEWLLPSSVIQNIVNITHAITSKLYHNYLLICLFLISWQWDIWEQEIWFLHHCLMLWVWHLVQSRWTWTEMTWNTRIWAFTLQQATSAKCQMGETQGPHIQRWTIVTIDGPEWKVSATWIWVSKDGYVWPCEEDKVGISSLSRRSGNPEDCGMQETVSELEKSHEQRFCPRGLWHKSWLKWLASAQRSVGY